MYKLTDSSTIIRLADNACIPADPKNTDYAEYLTWLAAGGVPEPADIPDTVIPDTVTMRQARLALLSAGLLSAVNAAIAALPEPQKSAAEIEWEYSQEVQRHNGLVVQLAPVLGLAENDLDQLFIDAAAR